MLQVILDKFSHIYVEKCDFKMLKYRGLSKSEFYPLVLISEEQQVNEPR